jgi:RNA polymerase sigma factor (sigma-70 family)
MSLPPVVGLPTESPALEGYSMATQQLNRLTGLLKSAYSATRLGDESDADLLDRCRAGNDPAAFEAIVRRHGGRVLAACRKVLSDPADVDDSFQATFLVLLQKPRAIRKKQAVGPWLYGVAHRVAVRARDKAGRRRMLLKKSGPATDEAPPAPDLSWREACCVLHEELDKLPDSLRLPLVLCYLDGLSRDEAAHQLGWSLNEVRGRLERGRDRLRKRLERRGIALSAGLLAMVAGNSVTAGGPPVRFVESAMRAAQGRPTDGAVALANGATHAMVTKFKIVGALVLAAGVLAGVGSQHHVLNAGPKPGHPKDADRPAAKEAPPTKPTDEQPPEFAGRVVDADGKPVPGVKIHVLYWTPKALPIPERATTDADGKFKFTIKAEDFERSYSATPWWGAHVTAKADGYAIGWAIQKKDAALTIRLTKDDPAMTGRLLDLEGKPLAGVEVRLNELLATRADKNLTGFVEDLKRRKVGYAVMRDHVEGFEGTWLGRDVATLFDAVKTGADGRFKLPGVGPDRIATLRFDRPGIESRTLRVLSQPAESITVREWDRSDQPTMTFVGNGFDFSLAPGRTVTGVVKDKTTGKAIAGVQVVSELTAGNPVSGRHEFRATTDKDGKYTLHGLPLGRGNVLRAAPPADQHYLMQLRDVPVPEGFNAAPLDFELTRGVVLTGKVTDADTGKPVNGRLDYFVFLDDPTWREIKGFTMPSQEENDVRDGQFRVVVPATKGLLAFRAAENRYPVAIGAEEFNDKARGPLLNTAPFLCHATNYHLLMAVDVKPGDQAKTIAVKLSGGKKVTGRVLDPDGRPLAGALARGLKSSPSTFGLWETEPLKEAEFEAVGVNSKEPRALIFIHPEKKLAGVVRVSGTEKAPVEVKLEPWASIRGRLVNADGKPMAGVRLGFLQSIEESDPQGAGDLPEKREIRTDADGRFELSGFAPGIRYYLAAVGADRVIATIGRDLRFKAGEEKNVGEVKVRD